MPLLKEPHVRSKTRDQNFSLGMQTRLTRKAPLYRSADPAQQERQITGSASFPPETNRRFPFPKMDRHSN
jgi:hypothetical protein